MSAGKHNRCLHGFTAIELMLVLVVVAVLAGLAAPSMGDFISSSRLRSASSDFYSALIAARSEAIKRRTNAVVEPLGSTWSTGWTVKVGSNVFLKADALPADVSVQVGVPSASTSPITYTMNGRAASGSQTFIFYNASPSIQARCVAIDASGLPRVRADTNKVATDGCN